MWIETLFGVMRQAVSGVTPYAGVWIETSTRQTKNVSMMSLLMRECGLKLFQSAIFIVRVCVTPYAGVWIETSGL